jgi:hypothetical protein
VTSEPMESKKINGGMLVKFDVTREAMKEHLVECFSKSTAESYEDGLEEAEYKFEWRMQQQAYGEFIETTLDGCAPNIDCAVIFRVADDSSVVAIKLALSEFLTNPRIMTGEEWIKF